MKNWILTGIISFSSFLAWADDPLVIYSGRGEGLVGELLNQFSEDTGIDIDVRYNSTSSLATQVLVEGEDSPADVVFFQESGYLSILGDYDYLLPINDELLEDVAMTKFIGPDNNWVGTSARMRILAYNTDKFTEEDMPKNLEELADPKWKDVAVGWAPGNASLHAHLSLLKNRAWGEEETRQWLMDFIEIEPLTYQTNGQMVRAVGAGEIDLGWANHYYMHRFKAQDPSLKVANYHFPEGGEAGNLLIVSGVGIMNHTDKQDKAEALVAYLLSPEAQSYFTNQGFEYPTANHTAPSANLVPLTDLSLATVEQEDLSQVAETLEMLQDLNVL